VGCVKPVRIMPGVTILLPGLPFKSDRGSFGWCNIVLAECRGLRILFDTGFYGDRLPLLQALRDLGVSPQSIDYIVLSHLHYDHVMNLEVFEKAKVLVWGVELDYVFKDMYKKYNDPYVPKPYLEHYRERLEAVDPGDTIGCYELIALPGHTPGSLGLKLSRDAIATGDAVKNLWEMVNLKPTTLYSKDEAIKSLKQVMEEFKLIIPGHDTPIVIDEGIPKRHREFRVEVHIEGALDPYSKPVEVVLKI